MKITTIDKGTAEAITSRLHDAVRDVADSMGGYGLRREDEIFYCRNVGDVFDQTARR